jgi:hypothetical protein
VISDPIVIVLDNPSPKMRQIVHEKVKNHTKDWWHHLRDVWIVGGHSAHYWGRVLDEVEGVGAFIIFELPKEQDRRRWAASLFTSQTEDSLGGPYGWLAEKYNGKSLEDLKDLTDSGDPTSIEPVQSSEGLP